MKRKNVFEKADEFVKKVRERIPEASFHDCKKWAGRISNNYSYRKKPTIKLSKNEVIVNDVLLERDLVPTTAYKWLILCDSPGDIQELLKQKRIPIRNTFKENKNRSKLHVTSLVHKQLLTLQEVCKKYIAKPVLAIRFKNRGWKEIDLIEIPKKVGYWSSFSPNLFPFLLW